MYLVSWRNEGRSSGSIMNTGLWRNCAMQGYTRSSLGIGTHAGRAFMATGNMSKTQGVMSSVGRWSGGGVLCIVLFSISVPGCSS